MDIPYVRRQYTPKFEAAVSDPCQVAVWSTNRQGGTCTKLVHVRSRTCCYVGYRYSYWICMVYLVGVPACTSHVTTCTYYYLIVSSVRVSEGTFQEQSLALQTRSINWRCCVWWEERRRWWCKLVKWRVVLFVLLWKRLTPICNVNLSVVGETVGRESVPRKWSKGARGAKEYAGVLLCSSCSYAPLASGTHMYVILCRIRKMIMARQGMSWTTTYSKR
jgi:hypothetical protein